MPFSTIPALYQAAPIKAPRDGFPWFSARRARRADNRGKDATTHRRRETGATPPEGLPAGPPIAKPPARPAGMRRTALAVSRGLYRRSLVLGLAAALAAGCASQPLTALRGAEPQGSAYSRALSVEYRRFATVELEEMLDFKDADHFAKKGLAAARGGEPAPERVADWEIAEGDAAPLQSARNRLAAALANRLDGAAPAAAAAAQAGYDCWIEQLEEGYQPRDIARCRARYRNAVAVLEARGDYPHSVFFEFDGASLSPVAQTRVEKLAARARHLDVPRITVLGHADSSGGAAHNLTLSLRRADVVKRALIRGGVPRGQVAVAASGERRLRIATGDNTREARNRRVEILFQSVTAW